MIINNKFKFQIFLQTGVFVILLLTLVLALGYLSNKINYEYDFTFNKRNTLSDASKEVLDKMNGPIKITAFATGADEQGDLKKTIYDFLDKYIKHKKDIELNFIDPRQDPVKAEKLGIKFDGELFVIYDKKSENLSNLTEQEFTNLLIRLSRDSNRKINNLIGHGESSFEGTKPSDLSNFASQLRNKGFEIQSLNIANDDALLREGTLLMIVSPKVKVLPGETKRIIRYLENGGNLLWLLDHDSLDGLNDLADFLELDLKNGLVFDPRSAMLNYKTSFALSSKYYQEHPLTKGSSIPSIFPFSRQILNGSGNKFLYSPLIEVADQGWLERGNFKDARFNKNKDIKGPIIIGAALERIIENKSQRIVVIGNSNFIKNQYIGLLGNLDLGVNMINWLSGDDDLITIQTRPRNDLTLEVNAYVFYLANSFFLLPLIFLISSFIIWRRRKRY